MPRPQRVYMQSIIALVAEAGDGGGADDEGPSARVLMLDSSSADGIVPVGSILPSYGSRLNFIVITTYNDYCSGQSAGPAPCTCTPGYETNDRTGLSKGY